MNFAIFGDLEIFPKGKDLWKCNSSLLSNKRFVRNMKNHVATTTTFINEENIFDNQMRWEYLKFEIK